MRLDPLGQNAAEDVAPGVVGRDGDAGLARRGGERRAIALPAADCRQQIDTGVAREGFRHRDPLGRGQRIDGPAAKAELLGARRARRLRHQRRAVVHQASRRARWRDTIPAW